MIHWLVRGALVLALVPLAAPDPVAFVVPVAVPEATGAEVPAWRYVGPLDVGGLAAEDLCGETDRDALLRSGHFGWRVVVLDDGAIDPRWSAADRRVAEVCGVQPSTAVLLVASEDVPSSRVYEVIGFRSEVHLLVGGATRIRTTDTVRVLPLDRSQMLLQMIGTAGG